MKNKMGAPFISIIMNCYNSETYLREAIESVIAQTYADWELIFWDNQSTDGSAKIVHSYQDSRIKYFYAATHTDLGKARKKAVEQVSGKWLAFLDCDDLWEQDKLKKQVEIIRAESEKGNQIGLVYGRVTHFGQHLREEEVPPFQGKSLPEGHILEKLLTDGCFIHSFAAVINKAAYYQVGGFPENYIYACDYFLFCEIAKNFPIRAVQDFVGKRRRHENNLTRQMGNYVYTESIRVLKRHVKEYPESRKRLRQLQKDSMKYIIKNTLWNIFNKQKKS